MKTTAIIAAALLTASAATAQTSIDNPLWIVDGTPVKAVNASIWSAPTASEVAATFPLLHPADIKKVSVSRQPVNRGGVSYPGEAVITTIPCKVALIVDGQLRDVIKMRPGELLDSLTRREVILKRGKRLHITPAELIAISLTTSPETTDYKIADKFMFITTTQGFPRPKCEAYPSFQADGRDDVLTDGMFRIVDESGKVGYADASGKVVITPRFAYAYPFCNGKATVTDTGSMKMSPNGEYWDSTAWYTIDRAGNRIR